MSEDDAEQFEILIAELDAVCGGHVVGDYLQNHRKVAGLTQSEIAAQLGVSTRTLSMWERKETYPNREHTDALAEIMREIERSADTDKERDRNE